MFCSVFIRCPSQLLDKCCYALANLAFNNPPNMATIISCDGPHHVILAMTTHKLKTELLDSATCCLSNLCYNNDQNKGK